MAWYHRNRCDCPIGCCDCGAGPEDIALWYNSREDQLFYSNYLPPMTPWVRKGHWMMDLIKSGEWVLLEINRPEALNVEQMANVFHFMAEFYDVSINREFYEKE